MQGDNQVSSGQALYEVMFNLGDINHEWSQTPLKQIKKTLTFGFLGGRLGGVDDLHFTQTRWGLR